MFKKYILLFLLCFLAACTTIKTNNLSNAYKVEFGILEEKNDDFYIKQKTTSIPYITKEEGQVYGFVVEPSDNKKYDMYSIIYPPSPPAILTGDVEQITPSDYRDGYKQSTLTWQGKAWSAFWIDNADPTGIYRIEVFINKRMVKELVFSIGGK